jgi:hypothetical protein
MNVNLTREKRKYIDKKDGTEKEYMAYIISYNGIEVVVKAVYGNQKSLLSALGKMSECEK